MEAFALGGHVDAGITNSRESHAEVNKEVVARELIANNSELVELKEYLERMREAPEPIRQNTADRLNKAMGRFATQPLTPEEWTEVLELAVQMQTN